jgi:hypothetical protein
LFGIRNHGYRDFFLHGGLTAFLDIWLFGYLGHISHITYIEALGASPNKHRPMNCIFDICEFNNIILGGIVIGIITSFLFVWLTQHIQRLRFIRNYSHLQSRPNDAFDWKAYSMKEEDGRIRQENPNGSLVNIQLMKGQIYLNLKQPDSKKWIGELKFDSFGFGMVTFKYETRHEYGKRECVMGHYLENGDTYDYLFLTPVNNKIYYIETIRNQNQRVRYSYGDEIFIRKRAST